MNPATYIPGTCGAAACSTTSNYASRFALTIANPTQGPMYQGGGSGSMYIMAGANASYHGLVTTLQHRMSSSFVFLANYTWSHCIDISDNAADVSSITIQNPANIKGDKSSCGFDFRHVVNTTVVASSHFKSLHGLLGEAANNWQISPLVHVTDGAPFTVVTGVDSSLIDVNNDRPNLTNPSALYTKNKLMSGKSSNAQYISAAAFTINGPGTFGNSGRFAYRGPKFLQVDTALSRSFALHDTWAMNFRFEAFNMLNHPDFAAPGSSAGYLAASSSMASSTFGQITSTVNSYGARVFQGAVKISF